jgi:hypothetical protein
MTTDTRPRVFLSYSRVDRSLARDVHEALRARGVDVVIDTRDIAPAEEWRPRLERLILEADVVVVLMTTDSVQSDVCRWEVGRASELGKRVIPLAHGAVPADAPEALRRLNYIFSDDPLGGVTLPARASSECITKLQEAIAIDIRWWREYSRLISRADEWERAADQEREDKLLRRGETERAKGWLDARVPSFRSVPNVLRAFRRRISSACCHVAAAPPRVSLATPTG